MRTFRKMLLIVDSAFGSILVATIGATVTIGQAGANFFRQDQSHGPFEFYVVEISHSLNT